MQCPQATKRGHQCCIKKILGKRNILWIWFDIVVNLSCNEFQWMDDVSFVPSIFYFISFVLAKISLSSPLNFYSCFTASQCYLGEISLNFYIINYFYQIELCLKCIKLFIIYFYFNKNLLVFTELLSNHIYIYKYFIFFYKHF